MDEKQRSLWLCKCSCGNSNLVEIRGATLNYGSTKSCGCLIKETRPRKHGMHETNTYICWDDMKSRCLNINNHAYKNYGGRGIKICQRWKTDFKPFYEDMGEKPEGLTLDRIDNNKNYSCGKCQECLQNGWEMNCQWETRKIQNRNKRNNRLITFNGRTQCQKDWGQELNISQGMIKYRLEKGWSIEKTLTTPIRRKQ